VIVAINVVVTVSYTIAYSDVTVEKRTLFTPPLFNPSPPNLKNVFLKRDR